MHNGTYCQRNRKKYYFCTFIAPQPLVGLRLLTFEVPRLHSDTPHCVGLLWARVSPLQRPLPENTEYEFEHAVPASERP
jgi:hypothetical protein